MPDGRGSLDAAVAALACALNETGSPAMLIGGIAVIAHGVPRHTDDVDGTIAGDSLNLNVLLDTLKKHGVEPRIPDAIAFARQNQVLLLKHADSDTEIELSLAWLPFEHEALARAEVVTLGSTNVRIATVEDLVIYKVVAWRERDRSDIERLIELHPEKINFARVDTIVGQFAEALEEPERVSEFEDLKNRVLRRVGRRQGG